MSGKAAGQTPLEPPTPATLNVKGSRQGDDFSFLWPEVGISISFERLRDDGGDTIGDLHVQSTTVKGPLNGHVLSHKFNLNSLQTRTATRKALDERMPKLQWGWMLEHAILATLEQWRQGEPIVNMATQPINVEVSWLVDRFLLDGQTTLIYGDGGIGKGWFAPAVALAVETGLPLPCGLVPQKQGMVLYLDWEASQDEFGRRLRYLCNGLGIPIPDFYYREMRRTLADEAQFLRAECARLGVRLLVIDSVAPAIGGPVEKSEYSIPFMNALRSFSPIARLAIAHMSWASSEQKEGKAHVFGSVFFRNMARSMWEVRGEYANDTLSLALFHNKMNIGRPQPNVGLDFRFDDQQKSVRVESTQIAANPTLAVHLKLPDRVRYELKHGAQSVKALAESLETTEATMRSTLNTMPDAFSLPERGPGGAKLWALRSEREDR